MSIRAAQEKGRAQWSEEQQNCDFHATVTPDTHSLSKWHQISVELASGGHVSNFNKIS